jgi:hypothetical protein
MNTVHLAVAKAMESLSSMSSIDSIDDDGLNCCYSRCALEPFMANAVVAKAIDAFSVPRSPWYKLYHSVSVSNVRGVLMEAAVRCV